MIRAIDSKGISFYYMRWMRGYNVSSQQLAIRLTAYKYTLGYTYSYCNSMWEEEVAPTRLIAVMGAG